MDNKLVPIPDQGEKDPKMVSFERNYQSLLSALANNSYSEDKYDISRADNIIVIARRKYRRIDEPLLFMENPPIKLWYKGIFTLHILANPETDTVSLQDDLWSDAGSGFHRNNPRNLKASEDKRLSKTFHYEQRDPNLIRIQIGVSYYYFQSYKGKLVVSEVK